METYPETYWHCYVKLKGRKGYAVENDLTWGELQARIVGPWRGEGMFTVGGKVVRREGGIEEIKVARTAESREALAQRQRQRLQKAGVGSVDDYRKGAVDEGEDYTQALLLTAAAPERAEPVAQEAALVEQVCRRLRAVVQILEGRNRQGRSPFKMSNEVDVQVMLQGLLRAYLKHSTREEPLPRVGGGKAGRADIAIEDLGVIIEIKYAKRRWGMRWLVDEFANDLLLYAAWRPLKTLIYLVYNAETLKDPEGLEKLGGPQVINGKRFEVKVILS